MNLLIDFYIVSFFFFLIFLMNLRRIFIFILYCILFYFIRLQISGFYSFYSFFSFDRSPFSKIFHSPLTMH